MSGEAQVKVTKKKKDDEQQEVDINQLMESLQEDIKNCYPKVLPMPESYDPIQMLHNIELIINEKCTEIDYIQEKKDDSWSNALRMQEKERKEVRQTEI